MGSKIGEPVAVINPGGESYSGKGGSKSMDRAKGEAKLHKTAATLRPAVKGKYGKIEAKGPVEPTRSFAGDVGSEGGKPHKRLQGSKFKKPTAAGGQIGVSRSKKSKYRN
tara:strand:+ start:1026 stop:1355 length:330 start_codon:yes stop_codon:yes gene_type:complete